MRAVLLAGIAAVGLACGPAGAETRAPEERRAHLVIVSSDPLVVRGLRFEPGERVKLLVTVSGRAARVGAARASQFGRFTARLGAATGSEAVVVQAIGTRGNRATADVAVTTGTLAPPP